MSRTSFHLTYDGAALEQNEMAARQLAPALIAMSDVLEQANISLNSTRATVTVTVKASFRTGSFGIDFGVLQEFSQQVLTWFANDDKVVGALNLVGIVGFVGMTGKGLLQALKWLRGRPIKEIVTLKDGRFRILVDSEHYDVEREVVELLRNYELRRAIEDVFVTPLEQEGIDKVAVQSDVDTEPFVVTRETRSYFVAPEPEEEFLDEQEMTLPLQLVNVAFKDDNKWRFSDGTNTFYAEMKDEHFLHRVDRDEEFFSKNDILRVRMIRRQYIDQTGKMRTDVEILEVLKHERGARQLRLPIAGPGFDNDDDKML